MQQRASRAWCGVVLDIAFFGSADVAAAERHRELLSQHVAVMSVDPEVSSAQVAHEVLRSATSHVVWRLTAGPATTVAPGALVSLLGCIALLFAFTPFYSLGSAAPLSGLLGVVGGVLVAYEAKATARSIATRLLWALIVLGLLMAVIDYTINPVVFGDELAAVGTLLIAASMLPHALQKQRLANRWKRWAIVAIGFAVLGVSNLVALEHLDNPSARKISASLFVLESASAFALFRWSLNRRSLARDVPSEESLLDAGPSATH